MLLLNFSHMERTCPFPPTLALFLNLIIMALWLGAASSSLLAYCNDRNITVAQSVLQVLLHLLLFIYGDSGSSGSIICCLEY